MVLVGGFVKQTQVGLFYHFFENCFVLQIDNSENIRSIPHTQHLPISPATRASAGGIDAALAIADVDEAAVVLAMCPWVRHEQVASRERLIQKFKPPDTKKPTPSTTTLSW